MKFFSFLKMALCSLVIVSCAPQTDTNPAVTEPKKTGTSSQLPTSLNYAFTADTLNGLVMVDQGILDGRLVSTGHQKEGSTVLIFEKGVMWATGYLSPYAAYGHITKWSWKLGKHGEINIRVSGDPDSIDDQKHNCRIKVVKEFPRQFTKGGLPEKLTLQLSCNNGWTDTRDFHLPLPFFPSSMFGTTIKWTNDPTSRLDELFQGDLFRMRKEYQGDKYVGPLLDPYKGGDYQNSLQIDMTDIDRVQDQANTIRTIAKQRMFLFEHEVPSLGLLLSFTYCPIIFTPPGDDGYARQSIDRFELCSINRIVELTQGTDRALVVGKSQNANVEPLHSAVVFHESQ